MIPRTMTVLGGVKFVALSILIKTESALFLYCRFSLFLKDPFFQIIFTMLTET